ncbi:terminase large subunit domain-containing protein, partial [Streptomyces sp. NPDC060223]
MTSELPLWLPGTYTRPLSDDFPSAGDKLTRLVELAWKSPENPKGLSLDPWQRWLIRHVLETYPDDHPTYPGQLRYRQVVVSMGRQNGKSVLGAIFGLFGLLQHTAGPHVISVASTADQARIIYNRVLYVIQGNASLQSRFKKTTETRGIVTKSGAGRYEVKASKGGALQGLPISMGLYDEVHITKPEMWTAMVLGTAQRANGMVLGITTAGDDESVLLKSLYEKGRRAAAGDESLERFGFFLWEAPEGAKVDDPDALIAANPSLACGRMDLEQTQNDVRTLPEMDARRYRLN